MSQHPQLPAIRQAVTEGDILWKKHALERMLERGISRSGVKQAILTGTVIEQYPDDYPLPSFLIAVNGTKPLHAVLAWDDEERVCHLITAYKPDLEHFEADFKTRRTP